MAEAQSFAIETISLTKIFPDWWGRSKVVAVESLDLRIRYNEIYGFLGPNGSGKTTTIKMILNLLHPTKGAAILLGRGAGDADALGRVGYLPEESYLYPYLTARETLDFYGRLFGLPGPVRRSRIDTLLEMVGLSGMGSRAVGTFSKGMARRIGLAQALINDPDLLILDEPTSGMDPLGTRQIKDLLKELAGRGKTILLSSHLLADVEDICDRIGILYGGRMQVEGSVRELLEQHQSTQIQTGLVSETALEKIRQVLEQESSFCQISRPMDKLETFFIRTVTTARQSNQPTSGVGVGSGISGFLAGKKPLAPDTVLERLVSAKPGDAEPERTTELAEPQTSPADEVTGQKRDMLERLSHKAVEPVLEGTETASQSEEKKTSERIDKDLLDGLRDRKKNSDGTTEPTHRKDSKGSDNG